MTTPKLSKPSSGYGGRGYVDLFRTGEVLPSITTVLSALNKGDGITNWHVEQTVLYAITHLDELMNRSEEAGVRYLQYFSRRKRDNDDWSLNPYTAADFVLSDRQNTGDFIHNYIEDDLQDRFPTDPIREDHYQMVEAWHQFKSEHDIEVIATESTVFGDGYIGTADLFAKIDGVMYCVDHKSSRKVLYDTQIAQLASIGAASSRAVEVEKDTSGAVYHKMPPSVAKEHGGQVDSWWVEREMPDFEAYAVLQIRPFDINDSTGEAIEPFCKLHPVPQTKIDVGYGLFRAGLDAAIAKRKLKDFEKGEK